MSVLNKLACGLVCLAIFASTALSAERVDEKDQDLDRAASFFQEGNYGAALSIISPLADSGDARAQTYFAKMFLSGRGVQKDVSAGLALLRRAADQDYREAQFMLGATYAAGEPAVPVDYDVEEAAT